MHRISIIICVALSLIITGCSTTAGVTPAEKRQSTLAMKNKVLTDLYKLIPDVKSQISSAPGSAVLSNVNVKIIFASFGGGYGVVKINKVGKHSFLNMGYVDISIVVFS